MLLIKSAFCTLSFWITATVFLIYLSPLLGIETQPWKARIEFVEEFGHYFLIAVAVLAGINALNKATKRSRKQAEENLYLVSPDARRDRATRVFLDLYVRGERLREGTTNQRQEWDQDARRAIIDHCREDFLHLYISNTGRTEMSNDKEPLPDEKFENAMGHIERLLRSKADFGHFVK